MGLTNSLIALLVYPILKISWCIINMEKSQQTLESGFHLQYSSQNINWRAVVTVVTTSQYLTAVWKFVPILPPVFRTFFWKQETQETKKAKKDMINVTNVALVAFAFRNGLWIPIPRKILLLLRTPPSTEHFLCWKWRNYVYTDPDR